MKRVNNFVGVEYHDIAQVWQAFGFTKNGRYVIGEYTSWRQAAEQRIDFERNNGVKQPQTLQNYRNLDRTWKPTSGDKAAYVALFREDLLNPVTHMNQIKHNHANKGEGPLSHVYRDDPKLAEILALAAAWRRGTPMYRAEDIRAAQGAKTLTAQWCQQRRVPRIMPVEDAAYELARFGYTDIFDPKVPSNYAYQKLIEAKQRQVVKDWNLIKSISHDKTKGLTVWQAKCKACGHEDTVVAQHVKACPVCSAVAEKLAKPMKIWLTPTGIIWQAQRPDNAVGYAVLKEQGQAPVHYTLSDEPVEGSEILGGILMPLSVIESQEPEPEKEDKPPVSEETGTIAPSTKMDISDLPFD